MPPFVQQNRIVAELRRRVVHGIYPPGARIPPHVTFEREFRASAVTVQRALSRLKEQGFIVARNQRGTFVSDDPPHLHRYAVLLPFSPSQAWSQYWNALYNESINIQQTLAKRVFVFHGYPGVQSITDREQLLDLVETDRLAGLIFAIHPGSLAGTPLLDKPDMPRVSIGMPILEYAFPKLHLDSQSLLSRTFAYFESRGRRRLACIIPSGLERVMPLAKTIAESNLETRPYWTQTVSFNGAVYGRQCAHLLMHPGQFERPDCLFIADDNLVEHVTLGLLDAGVRVPDDLEVVAHANFPWATPSAMPIKRIGFDIRHVMRLSVEYIDAQRRGEACPSVVHIPAVFDHEVGRPVQP